MAPGESSIAEVAAGIRARIYDGTYAAGAKLPTREKIASEYGMSLESAGTALRMLAAEGLVMLRQGSGSFVLPRWRYRVTVTVPGVKPARIKSHVLEGIEVQLEQAEAAELAVSAAQITCPGNVLTLTLVADTASPEQAAAMGMAVARSAAGAGWNWPAASVSAAPAGQIP